MSELIGLPPCRPRGSAQDSKLGPENQNAALKASGRLRAFAAPGPGREAGEGAAVGLGERIRIAARFAGGEALHHSGLPL